MINQTSILSYLSERVSDPMQRHLLGQSVDYTQSKWYRQLADAQWPDGSWGRFHSMDSSVKQVFTTTEAALRRAWDMGLPKDDPVAAKCIALMERYLRGEQAWLDRTEVHRDGGRSFPIAFRFIIAANLSRFDPDNPLLASRREICAKNLRKAFEGGTLDEEIWWRENRRDDEIHLHPYMIQPAWLLQNCDCMDDELQRKFLDYLWHREKGIYYISRFPPCEKRNLEDKEFLMWLGIFEALCGFSLFPEFMRDGALPRLLHEAERLMHGDIALPAPAPMIGHYAESWRDKDKRKVDLLLRMARIIAKCA